MSENNLDDRMHKVMDDIESIMEDGGERQLNQLIRLSKDIVRIVKIAKEQRGYVE